jgi:hypothetical protein
VSEPITGSEDRRSEDGEDVLFGSRDRRPPTPPPVAEPLADAASGEAVDVPGARPAPSPASTAGDSELVERLSVIDRRTTALQSRLEEVARALGLLGRRMQEQAVAPPSSVVETAFDDTRLAALEGAVGRLASRADLQRLVDESVAHVADPLTSRLDTLFATQERELALIDGLSAAFDAEGAGLRMDQERVVAMIATLRDDLADVELERSGVTSTAAWSDVLARVERALTAQANRIEAVLATVRGAVSEQVDRQQREVATLVAQVVDEVARSRETTADRLDMAAVAVDQATARVSAQLAAGEDVMAAQLDAVTSTLASVTGPLAGLERAADDLATTVERSATEIASGRARLDAVETGMASMTAAMAGFEEVITDRLTAAASASLDGAADEMRLARQAIETAGSEAAAELRAALGEVRSQLDGAAQSALQVAAERAQATLDTAAERLRETTAGATETATRLEAFEGVLAAVLAEHDQALADQRAQLVYDLVSSLADNLTKRERKRLASRIEVPPAPQTADMSRRLREVFDMAANRDLTGLPRDEDPDEEDATPAPPLPKRVVRSPLADIIEDHDDLDEWGADLDPPIGPDPGFDELLQQITGLPETTRRRLVDEFGSVAALQAADDDTVMSVRGVGPALLERLRRLSV